MWRGTNSATPGYSVFAIIPRWGQKSKIFLSVVNYVVKAVFWPAFTTCQNPANARAARLSGLPLLVSRMVSTALPKQARGQLCESLPFCFVAVLFVLPKLRTLYSKRLQGLPDTQTEIGRLRKKEQRIRHCLRRFSKFVSGKAVCIKLRFGVRAAGLWLQPLKPFRKGPWCGGTHHRVLS